MLDRFDKMDLVGKDMANGPVLLLLGAGASVDAGIPTSIGLVEIMKKNLGEEPLLAFKKYISKFPNSENPNIEQVIRLLANDQDSSVSSTCGEVINILKQQLVDHKRADYLDEFILCDVPYYLSTYQPVFTLNYDTLFEERARKVMMKFYEDGYKQLGWSEQQFMQFHVMDGLTDIEEKKQYLPDEIRADVEELMEFMRSRINEWSRVPVIQVFKMHGSVNWFKVYNNESNPVFLRGLPEGEPIIKPTEFYSKIVGNPLLIHNDASRNALKWARQCSLPAFSVGDLHFISHMTFATDEKLSISYPSFYLQSTFEKIVRKVWLVVIVGYSFSDPYVNQLIRSRIRGDYSSKWFANCEHLACKTIIVDPHAWWTENGKIRTIDDTGNFEDLSQKQAIYINATARQLSKNYKKIVREKWIEHFDQKRPWLGMSKDEQLIDLAKE